MILHQALSKNSDGLFEIDMHVIRQMAAAFDEGNVNDETVVAKFIMAAFECGIDEGIKQSEHRHMQTALLMTCTAGNA